MLLSKSWRMWATASAALICATIAIPASVAGAKTHHKTAATVTPTAMSSKTSVSHAKASPAKVHPVSANKTTKKVAKHKHHKKHAGKKSAAKKH